MSPKSIFFPFCVIAAAAARSVPASPLRRHLHRSSSIISSALSSSRPRCHPPVAAAVCSYPSPPVAVCSVHRLSACRGGLISVCAWCPSANVAAIHVLATCFYSICKFAAYSLEANFLNSIASLSILPFSISIRSIHSSLLLMPCCCLLSILALLFASIISPLLLYFARCLLLPASYLLLY